jgi:hypothetical protein
MVLYNHPQAVCKMPKCFGCSYYQAADELSITGSAYCAMGYARFPHLGAECHDYEPVSDTSEPKA